jgi:hypothetical protein
MLCVGPDMADRLLRHRLSRGWQCPGNVRQCDKRGSISASDASSQQKAGQGKRTCFDWRQYTIRIREKAVRRRQKKSSAEDVIWSGRQCCGKVSACAVHRFVFGVLGCSRDGGYCRQGIVTAASSISGLPQAGTRHRTSQRVQAMLWGFSPEQAGKVERNLCREFQKRANEEPSGITLAFLAAGMQSCDGEH